MRFTEAFLKQPPNDTTQIIQSVKGEIESERLWIGYDTNKQKTFQIYCPYQIGNCIPELVTAIEAACFDNLWQWRVATSKVSDNGCNYPVLYEF